MSEEIWIRKETFFFWLDHRPWINFSSRSNRTITVYQIKQLDEIQLIVLIINTKAMRNTDQFSFHRLTTTPMWFRTRNQRKFMFTRVNVRYFRANRIFKTLFRFQITKIWLSQKTKQISIVHRYLKKFLKNFQFDLTFEQNFFFSFLSFVFQTEFHFDQVFASDATNRFVFEQTVQPFLSVRKRQNLTYICFGQTGSGSLNFEDLRKTKRNFFPFFFSLTLCFSR